MEVEGLVGSQARECAQEAIPECSISSSTDIGRDDQCTTCLKRDDFESAVPSLSPTPAEHVEAVDALVDQKLTEIVGTDALQTWTRAVGA